jgi:peptidoglycan/LPS O-acetylase OafA/YrhL
MAGLDGLRGIAVLAVIAYHLNPGWVPGGQLGVGVFFVLSGYLITDLLLAQRERRGRIALGSFWLRRARRLLPALWVMLLVVTLWVGFLDAAQVPGLRGADLAALFYYSNWWYAFQHVSYFAQFSQLSPLGHLWSLAVEEQFYLVWPLLLVVLLRVIRRRVAIVALILLGAATSAWAMAAMYQAGAGATALTRIYEGTDTRAFQLLFGCALAFGLPSRSLADRLSRVPRAALEAVGVLGLAAIVALVAVTTQYQQFLYQGGMVLLSVASLAALVALAHPSTRLGAVIGADPLRWVGVRSYGIYLWSYPIIVLTTPEISPWWSALFRVPLQLGATALVAELSWRFVEQPIRASGFRAVAAGALERLRSLPPQIGKLPAGLGLGAGAGVVTLLVTAAGVALAGVVPSASATTALAALPSQLIVGPPAGGSPAPGGSPVPSGSPAARGSSPCSVPSPTASPSPSPASSPPPPTGPSAPAPADLTATIVGDSIMIDLTPDLHRLLPEAYIDGQVSRQMATLPALLGQLRADGDLATRLVVELGTNGPGWSPAQIAAALDSYGFTRVVLVNAGSDPGHPDWPPITNQEIAEVAAQVPGSVIVNWYQASQGHPEYFMWGSEPGDGVHPGPVGAEALSDMIAQALEAGSPAASAAGLAARDPVTLLRCAP